MYFKKWLQCQVLTHVWVGPRVMTPFNRSPEGWTDGSYNEHARIVGWRCVRCQLQWALAVVGDSEKALEIMVAKVSLRVPPRRGTFSYLSKRVRQWWRKE